MLPKHHLPAARVRIVSLQSSALSVAGSRKYWYRKVNKVRNQQFQISEIFSFLKNSVSYIHMTHIFTLHILTPSLTMRRCSLITKIFFYGHSDSLRHTRFKVNEAVWIKVAFNQVGMTHTVFISAPGCSMSLKGLVYPYVLCKEKSKEKACHPVEDWRISCRLFSINFRC